MEKININDYNADMGILIDISDPEDFEENNIFGSINIPYEKLLYHHKELLNKDSKYYICCNKGIKSRKIVNILEAYGYNVAQLLKG